MHNDLLPGLQHLDLYCPERFSKPCRQFIRWWIQDLKSKKIHLCIVPSDSHVTVWRIVINVVDFHTIACQLRFPDGHVL